MGNRASLSILKLPTDFVNNPDFERHPDVAYLDYVLIRKSTRSVLSRDDNQKYWRTLYGWTIREVCYDTPDVTVVEYIKKYCEYVTIDGKKVPVYKEKDGTFGALPLQ